MSHTPGPWVFDIQMALVLGEGRCIADVDGQPNWRSNGRLIAEAPAMLACLQMLHTDELDAVRCEFEAILARINA